MDHAQGMPDGENSPERLDTIIERYHQLARKTQNPMYAFLALDAIFWGACPQGGPIEQDVVIPAWIAWGLWQQITDLMTLSAGLDPRIENAPVDWDNVHSLEEAERALNAPEFLAGVEKRRINYDRAMDLVPLALGLRREAGWNAFAAMHAAIQKAQEFWHYKTLRQEGMPSKDALQRLNSMFGERGDRVRYDRIKEGRDFATGEVQKPGE